MTFEALERLRRPRRRRFQGQLAALSLALAWSQSAGAGNLDAFYLSGDAALQGGAISADAQGGGAVWYNPAGLATLHGMRLDVSVNGYALRFGGQADFDSVEPGSKVTRLSRLDLNVVPTALTLTKTFGDVGVGFGIFVPTQSTTLLRTQVEAPGAGGSVVKFSWDSYARSQEYHIGPAFGWAPFDDFDFGASFLVNYRNQLAMTNFDANVASDVGVFGVAVHDMLDWIQVGAEFVLGARWQFAENYRLGVVVRTPALRLYQIQQTLSTVLTAEQNGPVSQTIQSKEVQGLDARVLTPFRFHVGLSHEFGQSRAAVEGSVQLPYDGGAIDVKLRTTWNARAGLRTMLGENMTIGGGIFTDQSPISEPKNFGDSRIDYYGTTLALDWGTPYGIYAKDGETFARPRTLVFGTTVALSYAIGLGSVVRAEVGGNIANGEILTTATSDVMAHEFTLHIGSSFSE